MMGATASAFWSFLSSSRRVKPFESLENSRATSMSPLRRAAFVRGPPASRALNDLNLMPYLSSRPLAQNGRVGHSLGPPRVSWPATAVRSDNFLSLYLSAVAWVTPKAFWSTAGAGSRAVRFFDASAALSLSAVALASDVACPAVRVIRHRVRLRIMATSLARSLACCQTGKGILAGLPRSQSSRHQQPLQSGQGQLGQDRQNRHQRGPGKDLDEVALADPVHD